MVKLTFANSHAYGLPNPAGVRSGVGTRAYAWFTIINGATGATSRREFALIDSGCDECVLDVGLLAGLGLTTTSSTVGVAGGSSLYVDVCQTADIEIEGVRLSRTLTFGKVAPSIIGRGIYLAAFDVAFTKNDWHHA